MKKLKAALLLIMLMLTVSIVYSQDKKADIQSLLNTKNFVFKVQSVTPMGGRTIQRNAQDELSILNDTLRSDLPYFGRAYSAPIDPMEGGFRFTSDNFNYKLQPGKKKGWDLLIEPKDANDVRQMFFSISENGYATLQLTSNNRQSISYYGTISANAPKKQ